MTTSMSPVDGASISPEQYRQTLEGLQLESIHLTECHATVDHDLLQGEPSSDRLVHVSLQQQLVRWMQSDNTVAFWHSYRLIGKLKRKQVLRVEAVYVVRYQASVPLSDEFVRIFQQSTLVLTTYPYFRELVDSTMRRMGIPPITLPMIVVQ